MGCHEKGFRPLVLIGPSAALFRKASVTWARLVGKGKPFNIYCGHATSRIQQVKKPVSRKEPMKVMPRK